MKASLAAATSSNLVPPRPRHSISTSTVVAVIKTTAIVSNKPLQVARMVLVTRSHSSRPSRLERILRVACCLQRTPKTEYLSATLLFLLFLRFDHITSFNQSKIYLKFRQQQKNKLTPILNLIYFHNF